MSEFDLLIALSAEITAHKVALANLSGKAETNQEILTVRGGAHGDGNATKLNSVRLSVKIGSPLSGPAR